MATPKLDAKTFEQWVAAPEVFERIGDLGSRYAGVNTLTDRLRSGLARAASVERTVQLRDPEKGPIEIPSSHWPTEGMYQNELWQTGQLTIFMRQQGYQQERYDYYGVRFDPAGLDALWAAAGRVRAPEPPAAEELPETPKDRRPLQDKHLEAWAAVFRAAYPSGGERLAEQSVAGCFPDKSVTRARLRAALEKVGKLKPGRPLKP